MCLLEYNVASDSNSSIADDFERVAVPSCRNAEHDDDIVSNGGVPVTVCACRNAECSPERSVKVFHLI
jgi:hypothetical protein